jgi:hypothetical protein
MQNGESEGIQPPVDSGLLRNDVKNSFGLPLRKGRNGKREQEGAQPPPTIHIPLSKQKVNVVPRNRFGEGVRG